MMGDYLLYIDNLLIGGIYDDRLLIKNTSSIEEFHLKEELPFKMISDVWDKLDYNIGNIIKEFNPCGDGGVDNKKVKGF